MLNEFLPPYLWIARAEVAGYPEMELIFDATAIPYSNDFCIGVLFFDEVLEDLMRKALTVSEEYDKERYLLINNVNQFIENKILDSAYVWAIIKKILFKESLDQAKESNINKCPEKPKESPPANEDESLDETQNEAPDLASLKAAWIQMIAQADLETPLQKSSAYCKQFMESRVDEAVLLQNRYNSLQKSNTKGLLSSENFLLESNRIASALLDFINSL